MYISQPLVMEYEEKFLEHRPVTGQRAEDVDRTILDICRLGIHGEAMSAVSLRLPDSLKERVQRLARRDGVSMNRYIALAVAEKLRSMRRGRSSSATLRPTPHSPKRTRAR